MPRGSMKKYFEEGGGQNHGGPLSWPGTADGYPVRGPASALRGEEYFDIPLVLDYHSGLFRLFVPEEKEEFDTIMDRIMNQWYQQHRRIDRWSDEHCGLIVWLEWNQIYGEVVDSKNPGVDHGRTTAQSQK